MKAIRMLVEAHGWFVLLLFAAGTLGLGEFRLTFQPSQKESAMQESVSREKLVQLAEEWERVARSKFRCAEMEPDEFPRRFIEHGAICHANCANQLRQLIEAGDSAPGRAPPPRKSPAPPTSTPSV